MILAIDPGKEKCGLAVLNEAGEVLMQSVVVRQEVPSRVALLQPVTIVVGEGAYGRKISEEYKLPSLAQVVFVNEKDSSRLARKLYWKQHPPRGFWKLVPTSLRVPPVPIDDLAAVIIGWRHLGLTS